MHKPHASNKHNTIGFHATKRFENTLKEICILYNNMDIPETNVVSISEAKEKRKLIRAPHRYRPDGTYNNLPLSPTYFKYYYNEHKQETECQHCHKFYTHKNGL